MNGTAPEPGQLVEVRRRQWIVSDVDAAAVAPGLPKRSLVKLSSIDEDALGEEIEVLWDLEPGAHVIERAGLPTVTARDAIRATPIADRKKDLVRLAGMEPERQRAVAAVVAEGKAATVVEASRLVKAASIAQAELVQPCEQCRPALVEAHGTVRKFYVSLEWARRNALRTFTPEALP